MTPVWYDTLDFRARFEAFIERRDGDQCWEWTGTAPASYGQIHAGSRDGRNVMVLVHRAVWELTNGEIVDGLWVLHKCDNPRCCRLDHLFLGTPQDNSDDMVAKGRSRKGRPRGGEAACGENNGNAKMTAERVLALRRRREETGEGYASLGKRFGCSKKLAMNIVKRKVWKHLP